MALRDVNRAAVFGLILVVAAGASPAAGPAEKPGPMRFWQEQLDRFRKLSPAARLLLVEKALGDGAWQKVARGDVTATIVERGSLEAEGTTVVCRAKSGPRAPLTVRWVIEEGTPIKKGERLIQLDDSALREMLKDQRILLEMGRANAVQATEHLRLVGKEDEIEVKLAEVDVKLAELELRRATGKEPQEKQILTLKLEQTRLRADRVRLQARGRATQAEAEFRAKNAVLDLEKERARELEDAVNQCAMTAPHDGLVVYHVPEQARVGAGKPQAIVAVGEPVREGQVLLRVCDLKRMAVNARVHEALIARVRVDQRATVTVDAFPNKPLAGQVTAVAHLASPGDWFATDVKLFTTRLALRGDLPALKPGMSAEVRIVTAERPNVVQVPVQALVRGGKERFCYVKTAKGVEERRVATGVGNDFVVEITEGLQAGEEVLRDPRALGGRIPPAAKDGAHPGAAKKWPSVRILVRSVRPPQEAGGRRSWVSSYGITYEDFERIAAFPGVKGVVPLRIFPADARHLGRFESGRVIATTPELPEFADLRLKAGRFLTNADDEQRRNVVVLGAAVADNLFPGADPLGKSMSVGGQAYVVVGVLQEQGREHGLARLLDVPGDRGVYLPLRTCAVRFGERVLIREGGRRRAEAVQLSHLLVAVPNLLDVPAVLAGSRELLGRAHTEPDWDVQVRVGP